MVVVCYDGGVAEYIGRVRGDLQRKNLCVPGTQKHLAMHGMAPSDAIITQNIDGCAAMITISLNITTTYVILYSSYNECAIFILTQI